jgi:hydroxymethylbilane synthase
LRRQAFLGLYAPQASAVPVRGNVPTRVDKVRGGEYEGIVLARAGLARLQLDVAPLVTFDLNPRRWICAPGQGVIALEMRADDDVVAGEAARLDDEATRLAAGLEREQLVLFGGGCHAPLGAFAHQCGQDAWELLVAAPGACGFVVTRFGSGELETVRSEAAAWQAAGRPARKSARQEEEWVSRPAQPWC